MSRTFGAPFGGTIRAGQYGFDLIASRSIVPPNFCGGAVICAPSIVVVALGEPGVPVICCACEKLLMTTRPANALNDPIRIFLQANMTDPLGLRCYDFESAP